MTYRLTTTHADGSQTVTAHDYQRDALDAAHAALGLGALSATIVRPEPRAYRARVLRLLDAADVQVAALERTDWTRAEAMIWARDEARSLRETTGVMHRPEVEVLR